MQSSPGSLPTDQQARRACHGFASLVGRIVNTTISPCPITFVELDRPGFEGFVGYCERKFATPMRLQNGAYLFLYHQLGLRREERFLTTLDYRYVYQATEDVDSWIFRYEYRREPEPNYTYPRSHLHLNAVPERYPGHKAFPRLHLPTGRVTVEAVVRHLLDEHEIPAISPDWQPVLDGAERGFEEIQRLRVLAPEEESQSPDPRP